MSITPTMIVTPDTWGDLKSKITPGSLVQFADGEYPTIELDPKWSGLSTPTMFSAVNPLRAVIRQSKYYGISGNGISNFVFDGFDIEQPKGSGLKFTYCTNINVRRFMVNGAGLSGVESQNCFNMLFEQSVVQFCGQASKHHGFYLMGGPQTVRGCVIRHCSDNGIASDPFRHIYEGNLIVDSGRGIWMNSGANTTTIRRNTFAGNRLAHIESTGAYYPTDLQLLLDRNLFDGKCPAVLWQNPQKPQSSNWIDNSDYFQAFTWAGVGDYRHADYGKGWPKSVQWSSTIGWDIGTDGKGTPRPYRFAPNDPQPVSLLPGVYK